MGHPVAMHHVTCNRFRKKGNTRDAYDQEIEERVIGYTNAPASKNKLNF